jgi:hypothetical protein
VRLKSVLEAAHSKLITADELHAAIDNGGAIDINALDARRAETTRGFDSTMAAT